MGQSGPMENVVMRTFPDGSGIIRQGEGDFTLIWKPARLGEAYKKPSAQLYWEAHNLDGRGIDA